MKVKNYKVGFYGGKFMPLHLGHKYCLDVAASQCEQVYLILFYGGDQEIKIFKDLGNSFGDELDPFVRFIRCLRLAQNYGNVIVKGIDVAACKNSDRTEDWDAETPLVLDIVGKMDAVYSSEPGYDEYFKRAYPWAKHILVDPPRLNYPISGTIIREMNDEKEKKKWMV